MAYADATRTLLLPAVRPLDCPDCGVAGALKLEWKPESVGGRSRVEYRCSTPRCRGRLSARSDGAPVGKPGNAATRRARKVLQERLGAIWRQADALASEILVAKGGRPLRSEKGRRAAQARGRILVYAWVNGKLKMGRGGARVSALTLSQVERVMKECDEIGDSFRRIYEWDQRRKARSQR